MAAVAFKQYPREDGDGEFHAGGSVRAVRPGQSRSRGTVQPFPEQIYVPPGWPTDVMPPGAPDWEQSAVAWLLDQCPADYRGYPVLRRHPVVLARFAAEYVESQIAACRDGLGGVRASLGEFVEPPVLEAALAAWHEQEALLRRRRREVALVEEALRGKVFIRKL